MIVRTVIARRALWSLLLMSLSSMAAARCTDTGLALQILGSGGPFGDGRAATGYVVWVDGTSRLLVDAGGGTFSRFHQAEATLEDLQLIALSHFHPDHSAELPALLWPRNGELRIAGPTGSAGFPPVAEFLAGLVGPDGVFRVLEPRFTFQVVTAPTDGTVSRVLEESRLVVTARSVPHGDVPTLAYRVEYAGASIVYSSDQDGSDPGFVDFARDADLLVIHLAASENATGMVAQLHARPSVWGQIAARANIGRLVLSHISSRQDLEANLEILQANYQGPLTVGEDLLCVLP